MMTAQSLESRWGLERHERLVFVPLESFRFVTVITNIALIALSALTFGLIFFVCPWLQDQIYWALFHNKKIIKLEKDPFNLTPLMNFSRFKATLTRLGWSDKDDQLKALVTQKRASKLSYDRRLKKILSCFHLARKQPSSTFSRSQPSSVCPALETLHSKLGSMNYSVSLSPGTKSVMEDIVFSSRFDISVSGNPETISCLVLMDGHGIQKGVEPINLYTKKCFFTHLKTYLNVYLKNGFSLEGVYEAFKSTLHEVNENYPSQRSGSTFVGVFFINNILFCVSVGDSKALLIDPEHSYPLALSADPSHPYYAKRLQKLQASVVTAGESTRVEGLLNMACALGDKHITNKIGKRVIKPSMSFIALPLLWIPKPSYIVLGSDGVFDFLHEREATSITRSDFSISLKSKTLVEKAFQAGSNDNLSCAILEI